MAEKAGVHAKTQESKQKCSNSCKQNTSYSSSGSPADRILQLQRTAGNQAVQRLIKSRALQAKLRIGQPNDIYEQEADRVAEQVMRMPDPSSVPQSPVNSRPEGLSIQSATRYPEKNIQRKEDDDEEEGIVQMKQGSPPYVAGSQPGVPSSVHEVLSSPGFPLDPATRAHMEPRFGHDFSGVRVHSGAAAEKSARDVNANAYTVGHNIVFGMGRFAPGTQEGRRLIAHELAHVVQQRGEQAGGQMQLAVSTPGDVGEREAEAAADAVVRRTCSHPSHMCFQASSASALPPSLELPYLIAYRVNRECRLATLFKIGCDELLPGEESKIDKLKTGSQLRIPGFASREGDPGFNDDLSCHRANKVAQLVWSQRADCFIMGTFKHGANPVLQQA